MKNKRFLAIFLVLTMLVSLMPVGFAAGDEEAAEPVEEIVEEAAPVEEEVPEEVVEEPETVQEALDPAELPEEPDAVEDDVVTKYYVTINYGAGNPQESVVLPLDNGVMTPEQENSIAPEDWEGHEFLGWKVNEETALVKLGKLCEAGPFHDNDVIAAQWKITTHEVEFSCGPNASGLTIVGKDGFDLKKVEHGTTLDGKLDVQVTNTNYDPDKVVYKVDGKEIDIKTYAITKDNTSISAEVPLKQFDVWFWLSAEDAATYATITDANREAAETAAYAHVIVDINDKVAKPEDPSVEHKTFNYWTNENSEFKFDKDGLSIATITQRTDLVANFTVGKVTVTFDPNGGKVNGQTTPYKVEVDYDTTVRSQNASKEGSSFDGWTLDGEEFNFNTTIKADITLVAKYSTNTVVLTYVRTVNPDPVNEQNQEVWPLDEDGTAQIDSKTQSGEWGTAFTPFSDVTLAGYTLDGWTDGTEKEGKPVKFDFSEVKANATLKAIWNPESMPVTLDPALTGVTVTFKDGTPAGKAFDPTLNAIYGTKIVKTTEKTDLTEVALLPLNDLDGYTFVGWNKVYTDKFGKEHSDPVAEYAEGAWTIVGTPVITEKNERFVAQWDQYFTVTLKDGDKLFDVTVGDGGVQGDTNIVPVENPDHKLQFFKFYVPEESQNPIKFTTADAKAIYIIIDGEILADKDAKYCEGFFNGDTEFDLGNDAITGNLTLTTKRTDVVKVTVNYNGGIDKENPSDTSKVIYVPKGKSLDDLKDLRGKVRFAIPELTREDYKFDGYKVGTEKFDTATPINAETTLTAWWLLQYGLLRWNWKAELTPIMISFTAFLIREH